MTSESQINEIQEILMPSRGADDGPNVDTVVATIGVSLSTVISLYALVISLHEGKKSTGQSMDSILIPVAFGMSAILLSLLLVVVIWRIRFRWNTTNRRLIARATATAIFALWWKKRKVDFIYPEGDTHKVLFGNGYNNPEQLERIRYLFASIGAIERPLFSKRITGYQLG